MKYFSVNSLYIASILGLSLLLTTSCASVDRAAHEDKNSLELWQGMSEPITQRYPILEFQNVNHSQALAEVEVEPEYFKCTEVEPTTLTKDTPLLDVSFIEADIQDALLELSLLTGITIITDDSIEGFVSINFMEKRIEDVISAIISPGNYGFRIFDSFIYVGSQSPSSPSFHLLSTSCLYKPVFLHPKQIVEMLTPYYQQYVNYFEGHDHLSIVAPDSIQLRIQNDVRIYDQAPQQILLEMSIIEVSEEALDILGVQWNRKAYTSELLQQNETSGNTFLSLYNPRDSASPIAQALINSVSALTTNEEIQIRAMPSIVTLDGREAVFSSKQTSWLQDQSYANGGNNQKSAITYGVELRIVPFISLNNQIRLEILQASVSDLSQDSNNQPKLISHAISTSVLIMDGETLVLGGLLQKRSRNQYSRVPGASRIPLFGALFKHKDEELVNTEVLIVIRPKIMKG